MSSFAALVTSMFDKVAALGDDISTNAKIAGACAADDAAQVAATAVDDTATNAKMVTVEFATPLEKTAPVAVVDAAASGQSMASGDIKSSREWPIVWKIFCNSIVTGLERKASGF